MGRKSLSLSILVLLCASVLLIPLFVSACGEATTTSTAQSTTTSAVQPGTSVGEPETGTTVKLSSTESRLPNGHIRALGFIDRVWEEGGKRYISIDYAEWLTGQAAVDAAAAEGYTIEAGEDEYWIRNDSTQKRTLVVADSVAITTSTRWVGPEGELGPADEQMGASCTWADFTTFWGSGTLSESEEGLRDSPWWIELDGSSVVKIDELYLA
jgi:hypothetical protein